MFMKRKCYKCTHERLFQSHALLVQDMTNDEGNLACHKNRHDDQFLRDVTWIPT